MARKTIYSLSKDNLGDMTTRELKQFIRESAKKVEKARSSRNKALRKSYEYISDELGTRRMRNAKTGKYETKLKLGTSYMNKKQLIQRARLLQGHLKIDVYTKNAKEYARQVSEEAMENFAMNTGVELTQEELSDFKYMISGIKDLIEKFESDNIVKLFEYVNSKGEGQASRITMGHLLREVYNNMPEGSSKQDLLDSAYNYIDMLYGES